MYSARLNGEPTTFGTSGMLYRSNKVMYDRLTNTLWSQLRGVPIVGELVGSGIELEFYPVALTTWGEWLAEYPGTKVMSRETGYYSPRTYEREDDDRSIYYEYRQNPEPIFPVWNRDERLAPKQEVLGLVVDGAHKAYPIKSLREKRVVNDRVNGIDIVIAASAISSDAVAFRSEGNVFALPESAPEGMPDTLVDADGAIWHVERDRLWKADSPERTLPAHAGSVLFWFGWYITHPDTVLYEETED